MKEKKQSALSALLEYAGSYRILTYLSLILSALSSVLSLMPFVFLWRIIREVLEVQPDFSRATGIVRNGWMAVLFATLTAIIYVCALLKDAPIILLDEATASLDVENETKVQGALSRLLEGKTVLVIAHRMRTVEAADKIVVLSDGKVAEEGSSADLLARENGIFRRMTQLQSASAGWTIK